MRTWFLLIIGAALAAVAPAADTVAAARGLATSGKRPEALQILEQRLAQDPSDAEARTLRGIILSWDGSYDDARRDLEAVLERHRDYGDALRGLINVELWSDHPERAEALARDALRRNPNDSSLLLSRAKSLRALGRDREALAAVRHLADLDPGNQEAARQKRDLGDSLRPWTASFEHSSEWFSDGRAPWREEQVQLMRQTPAGGVIVRLSQANRYSTTSQQVEIDAYPHIRPGTYAYVNLGYSADAGVYPRYRAGVDLFQTLGSGWETSIGFRQMHFGPNLNIYTPSLTKYYGNWMFTGRLYLTPGSVGTSRSAGFQGRRSYGDGKDYWQVRYGHGSAPAETQGLYDPQILNASSLTFEFQRAMSHRLSLLCRYGVSREDRLGGTTLLHYLAETSLYYRL